MGIDQRIRATQQASDGDLSVGTPQQFRWLHGIVKAVIILNLIDAVFTLIWVRGGLATEANTLIDEWVNESPLGFLTIKLCLVGMGTWLLWRQRRRPAAVVGIFIVFLAYYAVLLYHLQYASLLLQHVLDQG